MHLSVPPDDIDDGHAVIRGDDARHLATVLRAAPGMPVTVADGHAIVHGARAASVGPQVRVALTRSPTVRPPTLLGRFA